MHRPQRAGVPGHGGGHGLPAARPTASKTTSGAEQTVAFGIDPGYAVSNVRATAPMSPSR